MNFELNEDQRLMQQAVSEFVKESEGASLQELLQGLIDMDFMGLFVPENYGGVACDYVSYVACLREMAKASGSLALIYALNSAHVIYPLLKFGSDALKETYLPLLASGQIKGSLAFSDISDDGEIYGVCLKAEKNAEGYCLHGEKALVLNGGVADVYVVYALVDGQTTAFLVPKASNGLTFSSPELKMGMDDVPMATMKLDHVSVGADAVIGEVGNGQAVYDAAMILYNISAGAIATGLADKALEKYLDYGKNRVQFRQPVINFDAPREMVGDIVLANHVSDFLVYEAAALLDSGATAYEASLMARYFATKNGETSCRNAIQLHGGYGYTRDLGVEVLFRDCKGVSVLLPGVKPWSILLADDVIG